MADTDVSKLPTNLLEALNYHIGLTGCGPTLLEDKPVRVLTPEEIVQYTELIESEKKIRRDCFRQACIEVLGEDPETDWDPTNEINKVEEGATNDDGIEVGNVGTGHSNGNEGNVDSPADGLRVADTLPVSSSGSES